MILSKKRSILPIFQTSGAFLPSIQQSSQQFKWQSFLSLISNPHCKFLYLFHMYNCFYMQWIYAGKSISIAHIFDIELYHFDIDCYLYQIHMNKRGSSMKAGLLYFRQMLLWYRVTRAGRLTPGQTIPLQDGVAQVVLNDAARLITGRKKHKRDRALDLADGSGIPTLNDIVIRSAASAAWEAANGGAMTGALTECDARTRAATTGLMRPKWETTASINLAECWNSSVELNFRNGGKNIFRQGKLLCFRVYSRNEGEWGQNFRSIIKIFMKTVPPSKALGQGLGPAAPQHSAWTREGLHSCCPQHKAWPSLDIHSCCPQQSTWPGQASVPAPPSRARDLGWSSVPDGHSRARRLGRASNPAAPSSCFGPG